MIKIHNVRAGFATNSSSSHSIVMLPPGERCNTDEYHRFNYGWEQFTLADPDSKTAYLATQLTHAMASNGIPPDTIAPLINSWLGTAYSAHDLEESGVDHQSVWGLFHGQLGNNPEFVRAYHRWLMQDEVVILGGNDNGGDQPVPANSFENDQTRLAELSGQNMRVREDKGNWVLFNKSNGDKIRFGFNPKDSYDKASTPELVDVKLTNYCTYGCSFCLVPGTMISTAKGVMPIEQISQGQEVLVYNTDLSIVETATVAETYERDYEGDLYEIEMENGVKVCITPEHEIYVRNKGWLPANLLEENDEILHIREVG